jgi:hypothetical protein
MLEGMLSNPRSRWGLLLAPVIFAAHVAEEAPGYVRWFNSIAGPALPENGFVEAQLTPFLAALFLGVAAAWTANRWAALILLIWCSHFFFANAVYHIVASVALFTFSPGLVTGTLLYLPFFWFVAKRLQNQGIELWSLVLVVFFASLPSFLQTYMVVFERRRFY